LSEWVEILRQTEKKEWNEPQRKMMQEAWHFYRRRSLMGLLLLVIIACTGLGIRQQVVMSNRVNHADGLVQQLLHADITQVPAIIAAMEDYRRWVNPALKEESGKAEERSPQRLSTSLALLPVDPGQADYLFNRMLDASPDELSVIHETLRTHRGNQEERLWSVQEDSEADPERRFHAAIALASYGSAGSESRWDAASAVVADRLLTSVIKNPSHFTPLINMLRPVGDRLIAPLMATFHDKYKSESERAFASSILADYAQNDVKMLTNLLMDSDLKPFAILLPRVEAHGEKATNVLEGELKLEGPSLQASDEEKDRWTQRRARAAVALVCIGQAEKVWHLLRHGPDPGVRSYIVNWLSSMGADAQALIDKLKGLEPDRSARSGGGRAVTDSILFDPVTSIRRALILALGGYDVEDLSNRQREKMIEDLLRTYREDPDAGIHSAVEWALRRWRQGGRLDEVDDGLRGIKSDGKHRWYVTTEGQTMAIVKAPVEFSMGSPSTERDRGREEPEQKNNRIVRSFSIATKEVTVEQFRRFLDANPNIKHEREERFGPEGNCPQTAVTWYGAAAYCDWLSRKEHLSACYKPNNDGKYDKGMEIVPNYLDRCGYRLPSEEEWECACRAGATTTRHYGNSAELLPQYAWVVQNSDGRTWPCGQLKPNDLGLFDSLGNVYEWCHTIHSVGPVEHLQLDESDLRIFKGGAFNIIPTFVRCADRSWNRPSFRLFNMGFRVARTYH
jgi:formylglycine-generating enzyme required for sulfatase activity